MPIPQGKAGQRGRRKQEEPSFSGRGHLELGSSSQKFSCRALQNHLRGPSSCLSPEGSWAFSMTWTQLAQLPMG